MSGAGVPAVTVDFRNVQATVVSLYKCPILRHLIFRFGETGGAQAFLRELAPRVTMADFTDATPDPLVNVGITYNGLAALGVDPALRNQFDAVYKAGPDPMALGDVPGSRSDPAGWWEGQFTSDQVHCVVHLYLRSDDAVDPATDTIRALAQSHGLTELCPRKDGGVLDCRSLGGAKLHFGYTDGISHPDICWDDVPDTPAQINFRNFLLGYAHPKFDSAPESGPAAELARDSTYGMFRWLYQDVATFNRFLATEGPPLFPHLAPADAEELLAAKLMGRWRDGTPLVLSPDHPDPALAAGNDFSYASQDPDGLRCPFSSHIRVTNPRDDPLDPVVKPPTGSRAWSGAGCPTGRRSRAPRTTAPTAGSSACSCARTSGVRSTSCWAGSARTTSVRCTTRTAAGRTRSRPTAPSTASTPPSRSRAPARSRACPTSCTRRAPCSCCIPAGRCWTGCQGAAEASSAARRAAGSCLRNAAL